MHTPVFFEEVLASLQVEQGKKYIDATAGEGGHSAAIADKGGEVIALDWDKNQISNLQNKYEGKTNLRFICANYAQIKEVAINNNFNPVDGILFDFGLSMKQYNDSGRGFSYKKLNEPFDMRLGEEITENAADLINNLSTDQLYEILARYSEELHSRSIAEAIVSTRRVKKFKTVGDVIELLNNVLERCSQKHNHNKEPMYSRVFQAFRIAVNHEFDNIINGIEGALSILQPKGIIVVITFHSLEDRLIKQYVRSRSDLKLQKIDVERKRELFSFERSALLRIITFV